MATRLKLLAETTAPVDEIAQILRAEHGDPFHILGMHLVEVQGKAAVAIRAFLPRAHDAWVVRGPGEGGAVPLRRIHADGFFEAVFPGEQAMFPYRLRTDYAGQHEFEDPYRFPPVLSDFDLHLLAEGTHHKTYEKLGAHVMEIAGVRGVAFAVWAPNAQRVSVVGNFNHWDGRQHPLRVRGATGVWEIFIPGLREGEIYKFEIKGRNRNYLGLKSRPLRFLLRAAAQDRLDCLRLEPLHLERSDVDGGARGAPGVPRPAGDLRSSPGLVAALAGRGPSRPELSRTRRAVGGLRREAWVLRMWN